MKKFEDYFSKESNLQRSLQEKEINKLKHSTKFLYINIFIYILITIIEYWLAKVGNSQALRADALNNLSGVLSTGVLIFGIKEATDVDDDDILGRDLPKESIRSKNSLQLSRFRLETVFTLVTSLIIILIAIQIIYSGIKGLLNLSILERPNLVSAIGASIATVLMLVVWYINYHNGKKLNNSSLQAAAKDSIGDVATSFSTMITVLISIALKISFLDSVVSVVIGLFILWQGIVIFQEAALNLIDYVDPVLEKSMRNDINSFEEVLDVVDLSSRYNGNMLIVDIIIKVDAEDTAMLIYQLKGKIKDKLYQKYDVYDVTLTTVPKK
ncbi:cation diffusion facilitator family transporter [Companilactobacillus futsaii]|uniref:Cation diffusion facilitator family transporter n=2 Tax=Companilactobacillus futsaii TaxID=938155 RepID=A0A5B7T2A1_9LACO|nr:cation diffusion facilitator family transporter [Companilactobacillus futsaii]KRK92838.1 Co Zn Cd cation transporter [Companilactobacillus futsaii JCM 17355]QCX24649.1 cation diffusion facilitator family transporter [Companilactobacillus futsaii]